MKIRITKSQLADIIDEVLASMRGLEDYRPVNPVLASDGEGIEISSDLHEWAWTEDTDIAECYLADSDGETGESIAADMTAEDASEMIGADVVFVD